MNNISFLFGAGISIPSIISSTQEITDRIISGNDIIRHTDSSYYFWPNVPNKHLDLYFEYISENIEFIKIILDEIVDYFKKVSNKKLNYEDIFYFINEMYNEISGDTNNPAVYAFIKYLGPKIKEFFETKKNNDYRLRDMLNYLDEIENYMICIVTSMLSQKVIEIKGLDFLNILNKDKEIKKANIFTLNHDLLLEKYFVNKNIKYCNGFSIPINNVRYWEPKLFLENKNKFNLFKIHGSVDWYRMRISGSDWHDEYICIITDGNIHRSKSKDGRELNDLGTHPKILVGTYNKIAAYSNGIFLDLICCLNKFLNESENLIISGYSFGDKGVNSWITEWAYKSRTKRIVLIHPKLDDLKNNARGSIRNKWDSWLKQGKLKTIEKGIEEVNWEEIKNELDSR
jgi:hypothetical protein